MFGYGNKIAPKKAVLFPEVDQVKNFLSLTLLHSWNCVRINIFCFKKHQKKEEGEETQTHKQTKRNRN